MDQELLHDVFRREIRDRKIPLSLGKTCPVKCSFCYEKDTSYRQTFDTPLTTQEHWEFIKKEIAKYPVREDESWVIGGNEYMEWTDLFIHPKALYWLEEFLETTRRNVTMFTVGYTHPEKINKLAEKYPGRINYELSVITLGRYRKQLMPHGPSVDQVLRIIDGPAVTSANFYSFGPHTLSEDAKTISRVNPEVVLWVGCLTPLKHIDPETTALMRQGKKFLPDEARRVHDYNLPNRIMIHTESDINAFLHRNKIMKVFDACELDKKDTVIMAGNVYKILTLFRRNRARYLHIPNATLGGDTDCTAMLTFSDVAARLTDQRVVYLPRVIMEKPSDEISDIAGVTFEEFQNQHPHCRFKVLNKINSGLINRKLYEKGYLKNYVEDYIQNPLSKKFEAVALPN
ncbi:MAG: radical SAM protein [Nitrospinaceae bacterium]